MILTLGFLLVALAKHLPDAGAFSIGSMLIGSWCSCLAIILWQAWRRKKAQKGPYNQSARKKVLIVGAGLLGRQFAASLVEMDPQDRVVVGFIDDTKPIGGDILGLSKDLPIIAQTTFADEIVITSSLDAELIRLTTQTGRSNRLKVKIIPDIGVTPVASEVIGRFPILTLHEESVPKAGFFLKRALDVGLGGIALLLAAPLVAAIAILVKLDSAGPVLYKAKRVGKRGRHFVCYKFRTMVLDAERRKDALRSSNQRNGAFFKMAKDPRVTRVGELLRRYSLDELPQLWNVFLGEMSLVGPRPHPLDDFARYASSDLRRLDVVPGMTGLWQVTARRDPSFQTNMALDLEYIEHWNFILDLKILMKTISAVLQGTGS